MDAQRRAAERRQALREGLVYVAFFVFPPIFLILGLWSLWEGNPRADALRQHPARNAWIDGDTLVIERAEGREMIPLAELGPGEWTIVDWALAFANRFGLVIELERAGGRVVIGFEDCDDPRDDALVGPLKERGLLPPKPSHASGGDERGWVVFFLVWTLAWLALVVWLFRRLAGA
ncbi:MAG: hypothetical protein KC420_02395 [Myxococcales bacterium]|nr:hypothetical protein [Myxococcales bacterium]